MKLRTGALKPRQRAFLVALPLLALLALILVTIVNTPFWDEWELVPIFQHLHAGHFWWSDFWQQHNEHRVFFPTLLLVGLAELTGWNIVVECLVGLVFAALSFAVLIRVARHTITPPLWLLVLLSLIWFSPVQIENWLWGWQLEWFMNIFGLMLATYGLTRTIKTGLGWTELWLIGGGGVLAQFSLGSGTLVWPLIIGCLLYLRVSWRKVATIALLATVLYYSNYKNPDQQSLSAVIHHPITYLHYVALYLGRPLSFYHKPAALLGALLFVSFLGLSGLHFYKNRRQFKQLLPWIMLGGYAVGSGVITGLARLNLGIEEAYSSRYTTIASLLLISTVVLGYAAKDYLQGLFKTRYTVSAIAVISIVLLLVLSNWAWGTRSAFSHHQQQQAIKNCIQTARPSEACLLRTYPNADTVRPRLDFIKRLGWH